MRKTVLVLLVGGLALSGCEKANTPKVTPETPATATPPPLPAATPSPTTPTPKSAATSTPRPLAPEGVYFLRAAQSIETDAGIIGVKRGQQLTKTGERTYTTAAGEAFTLSPDAVTNDLEEVRRILGGEQQASATLAAWKQQQVQTGARTAQEVQAAATPVAKPPIRTTTTTQRPRTVPVAPAAKSSLSTGSTGTQGGALGATHSNDRNKRYKDPVTGATYWKDIRGRRHYD